MKIRQQLYFPTPIYTARVEEHTGLNTEMLRHVYDERDRDPHGTQRSNYRGLNGWHSRVDLHKDPSYASLIDQFNQLLQRVSDDSGYDPAYELAVTTMWAIINPPGSSNRSHIHPKCIWSGVYYLQTPDNCGSIGFTDPRTVNIMIQTRYIPKQRRPKSRWTKVTFTPEAGKIVVFPSWLYHAVAPNLSTQDGSAADRVIISFNVSQRKRG